MKDDDTKERDTTNMELYLARRLTDYQGEKHRLPTTALAMAPDEQRLLSAGLDFEFKEWRIDSRRVERRWNVNGPVYDIAIDPEGRWAFLGVTAGLVVWSLPEWTWKRTLSSHKGEITTVVYAPSQQVIIAGSADTLIYRWDVGKDHALTTLKYHISPISALCLSESEQRLISGDISGRLALWDLNSNELIRSWENHHQSISSLFFSADDKEVISTDGRGLVNVWGIPGGKCLQTLEIGAWTSSADYHPGKDVLVAGGDVGMRLLEIQTGDFLEENTHAQVRRLVVSRDGTRISTSYGVDELLLWEVGEGRSLGS